MVDFEKRCSYLERVIKENNKYNSDFLKYINKILERNPDFEPSLNIDVKRRLDSIKISNDALLGAAE